ncbi:MAG: TIM barrel protein [Eubacteriales bacterium]|nr:TIM barrel protein [Eubacteriales bacterium]
MSFTKENLALSTMWNFRKAHSGEELLDQILALGFTQVELNYQVRREWLPGIERYLEQGKIAVSSIHNVFPKTMDERFNTDSILLGYQDETLRAQAIALSKQSIDYAVRYGAKAVVFHPTEVPLDPEKYDVPLKKLVAAHQTQSDQFLTLQREMLAERRTEPYLNQMLKSIEELSEYVVRNRLPVKLGMENRSMCHQAPIFAEFDLIMERFQGGPVGIWLDTGHGIMMQELGLQRLPLSAAAAEGIVGMHIHDAVDGLDHYAPCTLPGAVLAPYRDYIERSPIKVLELSGRLDAETIRKGTELFVAQYGQ